MFEFGSQIAEKGRQLGRMFRSLQGEFMEIVFEINDARGTRGSGNWELQEVIRNAGAPAVPEHERFVDRNHPRYFRSDTHQLDVVRKTEIRRINAGIRRRR